MAITVQHKRGPFTNMPVLADGEFYLSTDNLQLYVGFQGIPFPIGTPMANVSLSDTTGKAAVLKTGTLTSTATTANQIVLTYTVTAAKVYFLEYVDIQARLTTVSATASVLGTAVLQIGGVSAYTGQFVNPTSSDSGSQAIRLFFAEPIPISASTTIAILTTPAAVTSMLWTGNFGGYEK